MASPEREENASFLPATEEDHMQTSPVPTSSLFQAATPKEELMGPILRRKKVVSLPVGDRFFTLPEGVPMQERQLLAPIPQFNTREQRRKQRSFGDKLIRRKQVSLDLFAPEREGFFAVEEGEEEIDESKHEEGETEVEEDTFSKQLFRPLVFAPKSTGKKGHKGGHSPPVAPADEEGGKVEDEHGEISYKVPPDDYVVKASRGDKIKALVLFCIMTAFLGVCIGWKTHENESHMLFGTVGIACTTPCAGDTEFRNFFVNHHDHFHKGDVISMVFHIDPKPEDYKSTNTVAEIVRIDHNEAGQKEFTIVHSETFGPPHLHHRETHKAKIIVDWEHPENHHIVNVYSSTELPTSFTLAAMKQTPLTQYSVIIAALIMVLVYALILLESIHRTLVAIFGSMIALFFFFLMHGGETESIRTVMLHQEWSTLGLLFGMMLLVGELSHTGIFEWIAVRLLVSSKGSFYRLLILLGVTTALASAFLDNVTTMLLLAPVTIDMCNILDVDPRPYLISEVILSNIGGTATLIGDPPNIIIGSSFEEVGFVDFIINIMPFILIIAVPVTLILMLWIYKPYLTMKKMAEIDGTKLKAAYPVYDEPRLYIAGTTTFFVILLFFLHPVHHKDTAWIALIGAFMTITFTNPHDVQDALRNHVEWDTLLFFAGLFVLVEVCAAMGLLEAIGGALATVISNQNEGQQLTIAITLIIWVSAITSAFLDNIPYTATMIPVIRILHEELPETLPLKTLAWALSFGACLGGNGTLLGASANIVTAGISTNKGYSISFLNFFYPGILSLILTTALANLYMLIVYVWV